MTTILTRVPSMLSWSDIDDREDAVYYSEAFALCRAEALTPHQVASLMAGGVLRDDFEVESYDDWTESKTGDYSYEDRYREVQSLEDRYREVQSLEARVLQLEAGLDDALKAFKIVVDRLVENEERIGGLETIQARGAVGAPVTVPGHRNVMIPEEVLRRAQAARNKTKDAAVADKGSTTHTGLYL